MDNPKLGPSNKKKGCPRAKRESINQPSDIYALILPVRGGMAFTGLGKLGPAKKIPTTVKLSSMKQRPTLRYIGSYQKCNFVAMSLMKRYNRVLFRLLLTNDPNRNMSLPYKSR